MKTKIINLIGPYQYTNKVLINNSGLKLIIANRSNTSKTKTPLFLLDKTTIKGGYISSLYPLADACIYKFDYEGFAYKLTIDEKEGIANIDKA